MRKCGLFLAGVEIWGGGFAEFSSPEFIHAIDVFYFIIYSRDDGRLTRKINPPQLIKIIFLPQV